MCAINRVVSGWDVGEGKTCFVTGVGIEIRGI